MPVAAPLPVPGLVSLPAAGNLQPNAVLAGGAPAAPAVADPTTINSQPSTTCPLVGGQLSSGPSTTPAPGESTRAFEAFCAYLQLGPRRRYTTVARNLGVGLRTVKRWATQFDWRTRVSQHAAHAAALSAQVRDTDLLDAATREQSLRERQLFLAETIMEVTERYFERIEDTDFEHVRLSDACRALEFASRLLAQAQSADNAKPDAGLRDQLAALLDQAFRETPKPTTP